MLREIRHLARTLPLLGLLAGCATPMHAPAPDYRPGERFVYRDESGHERVREVVAVGAEGVEWRTESGVRFTKSDPFEPMVAWEGVRSTGRAERIEREGVLWPLARGARSTIRIDYARTSRKSGRTKRYSEFWSCKVNKPREREVPAGRFAVWKVVCKRQDPQTQEVDQTYIWYWSSGLGHWVERVKKDADGRRERLVLVTLPADARG